MKEIGHIYLSWRKGLGESLHIVGVIKRSATTGVSFSYISKNVDSAIKAGFSPYTEFPDISRVYTENVLDFFGQRLINSKRSDIADFYKFWEIDIRHKENKYYLLAYTQGLTPTDNFEFLADYNPDKNLRFLTDLAGLSILNLSAGAVKPEDILTYTLEADNKFDDKAVRVWKGKQEVGYIKKIHSGVFHKAKGTPFKLVARTVVEQNGVIKRIFVRVSRY